MMNANLPLYTTLAEARNDGYDNVSGIAAILNLSRQTVHAWGVRRESTRFPSVSAHYRRDSSRLGDLFILEDVLRWKRNYKRNLGGRPVASR